MSAGKMPAEAEEAESVSGVLPMQNALRKGHLPKSAAMPESNTITPAGVHFRQRPGERR